MKSMRILALAPVAAIALAGCGGSTGTGSTGSASGSQTTAASGDCSSKDVFCVGLVTDTGKVDDKSFNQAAWAGVEKAESDRTPRRSTSRRSTPRTTPRTSSSSPTASTTSSSRSASSWPTRRSPRPRPTRTRSSSASTSSRHDEGHRHEHHRSRLPRGQGRLRRRLPRRPAHQDQQARRRQRPGDPPGPEVLQGLRGRRQGRQPQGHRHRRLPPGRQDRVRRPGLGCGRGQEAARPGRRHHLRHRRRHRQRRPRRGRQDHRARAPTSFCIGVDLDQYNTLAAANPCLVTSAEKKITESVAKLSSEAKDGSHQGRQRVGTTGISDFHDLDDQGSGRRQDQGRGHRRQADRRLAQDGRHPLTASC